MKKLKICAKCHEAKDTGTCFYCYKGVYRSECKKCSIKRNGRHQFKNKTWKEREVDREARRVYMRAYYQKNKAKFAEYREEFREKYPDYYKQYFRKKKEK